MKRITESRNPRSTNLDKLSALEAVQLMNAEEAEVLNALNAASKTLANAAERVADAFLKGGTIFYVGSGTSGRLAALDAAEMPPTFGTSPHQFVAILAGGETAFGKANEGAEDEVEGALESLKAKNLNPNDVLIGIAASGETPYVLGAIRYAKSLGVWTCGIANNPESSLLNEADLGILLNTGPEVLTGSTRLKAGTAQKLALNRISTVAMVLAGRVRENLMIEVKATNEKLRKRSVRIVQELTSLSAEEAETKLREHSWSIRAVLDALGG